ncbi:MAG: hypothetical protein ABS52_11305 [Gemmatimonadetes bacterium SCN 70-22]|nr:MAG: hypothetical protein ABS52_11305 [Gemmatimonadetes bacterium SCN 70-22]
MFAAVIALAGPLTAMAHGVAHANARTDLLAVVAGGTSSAPSSALDDGADAYDHAGLHTRNTRIVEPVSVALLTATVAVLVALPVVREPISVARADDTPALSAESASADQPRAPPLG